MKSLPGGDAGAARDQFLNDLSVVEATFELLQMDGELGDELTELVQRAIARLERAASAIREVFEVPLPVS